MNLVDGIVVAYAAIMTVRGRRRGGAEESYRLLRLAISILAGCGLFALIDRGVEAALTSARGGAGAGALGFAAGLGTVYIATRRLKTAAVSFLQKLVIAKYSRLIGAVAGCLRALTVVSALIAFLQLSPWIPGVKGALESSLIGHFVEAIAAPHAKTKDADILRDTPGIVSWGWGISRTIQALPFLSNKEVQLFAHSHECANRCPGIDYFLHHIKSAPGRFCNSINSEIAARSRAVEFMQAIPLFIFSSKNHPVKKY